MKGWRVGGRYCMTEREGEGGRTGGREGGREGGRSSHLDHLLPFLGQDHLGDALDRFVPGGRPISSEFCSFFSVFFLFVPDDVLVCGRAGRKEARREGGREVGR
jgi:hypothetical protein